MIKLLGYVPREITIAVSGGIDSMVLLNFLSFNHKVTCAFFHHGTDTSEQSYLFLKEYCKKNNLPLHMDMIKGKKSKKQSQEEWWRECRYEFLDQFGVVATAHHLDDVVETWIWSSLHGCSSLLPYNRKNIIRPLLLNRKFDLEHWSVRKNVPYVFDHSNNNVKFTRNYIRHELMPHALKVNPGIHTMLRKKLIERQNFINFMVEK